METVNGEQGPSVRILTVGGRDERHPFKARYVDLCVRMKKSSGNRTDLYVPVYTGFEVIYIIYIMALAYK